MIDSFKELRDQRSREEEKEQQEKLQNGQVILSPEEEEEQQPPERILGLDLGTWEDRSYEQRERSLQILSSHEGAAKEEGEGREHAGTRDGPSKAQTDASDSILTSTVVVRERSRTLDEPSQKTTRAKRESRRMRELEQAKFSLDLLKVRATSTGGGASSPSEDRRWSVELVHPATPPPRSPQGTPDSHSSKGSFEILIADDEAPAAAEEVADGEDRCSSLPSVAAAPEPGAEAGSSSPKPLEPHGTDAAARQDGQRRTKMDPAAPSAPTHPPNIESYLPTFYVPAGEAGADASRRPAEEPKQNKEAAVSTGTAVTKLLVERRESPRRPVVVVISMQKEAPLSPELSDIVRPAAEARDAGALDPALVSASVPRVDQAVIEKLVRLNEEKEVRQRHQQQQNEKEMMEQIRQQKEALGQQRSFFARYEKDMFEKQRGDVLHRIQQSRHAAPPRRPSSLLIEGTAADAPHARTQSDSTAPSAHSPPAAAPHAHLPPPPASITRERRKERRRDAEGWAPKLTLESKDGGARASTRASTKKTPSDPGSAASLTDTPNIFFSPKDKVTFTK